MTLPTRKEVRHELGELLSTLVGTDTEPFRGGKAYPATDFGGATPIFTLRSDGDLPTPLTKTAYRETYHYFINIAVLRGSPEAGAAYTEEQAEDVRDDAKHALKELLKANRIYKNISNSVFWNDLVFTMRSESNPVRDFQGEPYWMESVPITVEVY